MWRVTWSDLEYATRYGQGADKEKAKALEVYYARAKDATMLSEAVEARPASAATTSQPPAPAFEPAAGKVMTPEERDRINLSDSGWARQTGGGMDRFR
jgi:hypothetical protein